MVLFAGSALVSSGAHDDTRGASADAIPIDNPDDWMNFLRSITNRFGGDVKLRKIRMR